MVGANMIVVDLNPDREAWARSLMTHFVNPKNVSGDLVAHLVELTAAARTTRLTPLATPRLCARR